MAQILFLVSVFVFAVREGTLAAPSEELVEHLPGLLLSPKFKQYSGFLQGVNDIHLHYWLVESARTPGKDPLVLWLNGAPGCSSLTETVDGNGPFRVREDGVRLDLNPHAWNSEASLVYLEAPAGVGFSYSESKNYTSNDVETATNNYVALKDLFRKFPEFKDNDFYIAGSGYGGVYVVSLVRLVMADPNFKLKGFLVGNGFTSNKQNGNSLMYFLYHHDLVGAETWAESLDACCPKDMQQTCDFTAGAQKPKCKKVIDEVQASIRDSRVNLFKLDAECDISDENVATPDTNNSDTKYVDSDIGLAPYSFEDLTHTVKPKKNSFSFTERANPSRRCLNDQHIVKYFNSPDVRKALHIHEHVQPWSVCNGEVQKNYTKVFNNLKNQYKDALDKALRILVYNGDLDITYNFLGSQWFVGALQIKDTHERKFWFYTSEGGKKQIAGFVKVYGTLTLATVKGAGHFVSKDKPGQAAKLFSKFIKNKFS